MTILGYIIYWLSTIAAIIATVLALNVYEEPPHFRSKLMIRLNKILGYFLFVIIILILYVGFTGVDTAK